MNKDIWDN